MELILFNSLMILSGGLMSKLLTKVVTASQLEFTIMMVNITVLVVGISGATQSEMPILMLVSIVVGSLIGSKLEIDEQFQKLGRYIENKIGGKKQGFGRAFILMTMIHCVGSMAILGPLNLGLTGDNTILLIKSVLDFISALVYGSIYGLGVIGSALVVLVYQGAIYLLSSSISSFLSPAVVVEIGAVGSVLVIALALHLLEIKEIKVANGLPAILVVVLYQVVLYLW